MDTKNSKCDTVLKSQLSCPKKINSCKKESYYSKKKPFAEGYPHFSQEWNLGPLVVGHSDHCTSDRTHIRTGITLRKMTSTILSFIWSFTANLARIIASCHFILLKNVSTRDRTWGLVEHNEKIEILNWINTRLSSQIPKDLNGLAMVALKTWIRILLGR